MTTDCVIDRLGHQGDGIADGPIFAPYTLPGERVRGVLDGQTLRDVKIIEPSGARVKAPCRHFPACGGCRLQHASDAFLTEWKKQVVRQALTAHGIETEFSPTHTSPAQSRRRAVVSARRTKSGAMVGFHGHRSDTIIDTPDCQLLHPDLMAAFPAAQDLANRGASRKHGLSILLTRSEDGIDADVTGGKPMTAELQAELADLAGTHDLARLAWEGEVMLTRRAPRQVFGTARVVPPPGAFLQATEDGEACMQADLRAALAGAGRVADLFSGCGTFALDLAATHEVHAVEGSGEMIRALDAGWRGAEGLRRVTHEARDLFRRPLLKDELHRFDAVLLDPPRAGAEAQIAQLCAADVPVIAYVSCNPVSFARDAAQLMQAGYQLDHLRVVDQFRWSPHVELVAKFQRQTG